MTKEEPANVRAWANENGHAVTRRGRVRGEIIAAHHAAHYQLVGVTRTARALRSLSGHRSFSLIRPTRHRR
jgi:Lsr2 protein